MSEAVAQILRILDRLSPEELSELRRELNAQVPMTDDLTEEDFGTLGAAMFRNLDEEEDTPRA